MKASVVKVFTDEQEVVYINGELKFDDHNTHLDNVLRYLTGHVIDSFKIYYLEDYVFNGKYGGQFPQSIREYKPSELI